MKRWFSLSLVVAVMAFAAAPVMAADILFQDFFSELTSLDRQARQALIRGLSDDERRSLHEQFRALPDADRAAAAEVLLPRGNATAAPKAARAIATVGYDSGVAHPYRVNTGNVVGNMFNTGFGDPHTLTTVTVQANGTFNGVAGQIFGVPAGSTAPLLTTFSMSPAVTGAFFSVPIPNPTTPVPITGLSGTFLAGMDQSGTSTVPGSTFRDVAVDINDAGFGFHGMSIASGGTGGFNPMASVCLAGTSVTTFSCTGGGGPFNAMLRVTGENLPVELMTFTAE